MERIYSPCTLQAENQFVNIQLLHENITCLAPRSHGSNNKEYQADNKHKNRCFPEDTAESQAQSCKRTPQRFLAHSAENCIVQRNNAAKQAAAPKDIAERRVAGIEHKAAAAWQQPEIYGQDTKGYAEQGNDDGTDIELRRELHCSLFLPPVIIEGEVYCLFCCYVRCQCLASIGGTGRDV